MDLSTQDDDSHPWKRICDLKTLCLLGACHDEANRSSAFNPSETSALREVSAIRESGLKGCPVCRFLLQVVDELFPGWTSEDIAGKRITMQDGITLRHHGEVIANFSLKGQVAEHMYPRKYIENGMGRALIHAAPLFHGLSLNVLPDTFSILAFDRARAWLEYCEKNDHNCKPSSTNTDFMPRRLLDVQCRASSDRVLLVEGAPPSKYACLSYCWGKNAEGIIRTLRESLQDHLEHGIEYRYLPKTLYHAVLVCHGLGLSYLWIDSLCIVQDDPEDWAGEAPRMSEIYGRSHLTIFANQSESCHDGFLGPQNYGQPTWRGTIPVPLPSEYILSADTVAVQIGTAIRSRIAPGTDTFGDGRPVSDHRMAKSQLDTRAWCLQEELLPNRRLYFDGNEMTWECCTRSFCECGHMNEDKRPNWSNKSDTATMTELKMFLGLATARSMYYSPEQVFNAWKWVLEDYNARFITNPSDKLVAVSGVASMMMKAIEAAKASDKKNSTNGKIQPYCAGLWRQNFLVGLSWTAVPDACHLGRWKPPSRSSRYRAPSWSWASNDAPIEYVSHRVFTQWTSKPTMAKTRTKVDEVWCEPLMEGNVLGQIKSGYACMTGPLVPVELVRLDAQLSKRIYNHFGTTNRAFRPEDTYQPIPIDIALVRGKNLLSYPVLLDMADIGDVLSHEDKSSKCWMERICARGCCGERSISKAKIASIFRRGRPQKPQMLFCMELFTWEDDGTGTDRTAYINNHYPGIPPETWFLVLREVSDGIFERVGAGFCQARSDRELKIFWPRIGGASTTWNTFECPLFQGSGVRSVKIV